MDVVGSIVNFGKELVEFLVIGIGLGYIGKRIVAEYIIKKGRYYIDRDQRKSAIWNHYQNQAKGHGHSCASPVDCSEGKCQVFGGSKLQVV